MAELGSAQPVLVHTFLGDWPWVDRLVGRKALVIDGAELDNQIAFCVMDESQCSSVFNTKFFTNLTQNKIGLLLCHSHIELRLRLI